MKAIDKTIWTIENHHRAHIALDSLAVIAGISRYHLSRKFCYAVGLPISRYIRLRRLSIGYRSHEAFTRAFKDHFALTPEQVRTQGNTDGLNLTEAISMKQSKAENLAEPRLAKRRTVFRLKITAKHGLSDAVATISCGVLASRARRNLV